MKKTYINPAMTIVKMKPQQLLAGSDPQLSGTYTGGSVLGRDGDADFEEDDDFCE